MKKAQFFLRFSFLTKKQQHEFGRYLLALHPKKQTAIAIYQFYESKSPTDPVLQLPRQELAPLVFPTQKGKETKLYNGLSDLNIALEEYLHWITSVKGVRNQQQSLALVKAYTKNGDEKGLTRVVNKLESELDNTTYKTLDYYKVYSELMDLKIGVPFKTYRKEILKNYQQSAYLRSQLATRSALTYMVEYECNHVANRFDFELPMRKALNSYLQSGFVELDNYLKAQLKLWELYESKEYGRFSEFRDEILNLIPDENIDEKVEVIKMLNNFIIRNRSNLKVDKAKQVYFELNRTQLDLLLKNKQTLTPTLYMNFMFSSKGVTDISSDLLKFKMLLPTKIRDIYCKLALTELAIYYHNEITYWRELLEQRFKDPTYEIVRRRCVLIGMTISGFDADVIFVHINNFRQYLFRNKPTVSRIAEENLLVIRGIELLLNPNTIRRKILEYIESIPQERVKAQILLCWKKIKPAGRNIPTNW